MAFNKLGEAFVEIALRDKQFHRGIHAIEIKFSQSIDRMSDNAKNKLSNLGTTISGVLGGLGIARLFGAAKNGFTDLISTGFAFNSQLEQMKTSMTQMLGSAAAADKVIAGLSEFSESTPFQMEGLASASVALLSTRKIAEEQLLPTLKKLGDAAAGSSEGFSSLPRITRAITQMLGKGKLQAEEMLQLAEAGIPAWDALSQATGKSTAELQKMGERGQLGADMVLKLIDGLGARFEGLAIEQSKNWAGLWSTFSDKARKKIGEVTKPLFELAKVNLSKVIEFLDTDKAKNFIAAIVGGMSKVAKIIQSALDSPLAMAIAKFAALASAAGALAAIGIAIGVGFSFISPLIPVIAGIAAATSVVAAEWAILAKTFKMALESESGKAIIENLKQIKDLAIEIGANLRDAVGRGIQFVADGLSALFGGDATATAGQFWDTVTSKMAGFLDAISFLTTDFGKTWELFKASALLSLSDIYDSFSHFFKVELPYQAAAFAEGMAAAGIEVVKQWKPVYQGFVDFLTELFVGFFEKQKENIAALKDLATGTAKQSAVTAGKSSGGMTGIAVSAYDWLTGASKDLNDKQVDAMSTLIRNNEKSFETATNNFESVLGRASSDIQGAFSTASKKILDVKPEKERSDFGQGLQDQIDAISESISAQREENRLTREHADAIAAAMAAQEKLKLATEAASEAAKRKAEIDAAAAMDTGPQLSEEQKKLASDLKEKFKPATEKFKDAAKKIESLFAAGGIDQGIRDAAIRDAMENAAKDTDKKSAAFTTPDAIANKLQEAISGGTVQDKQLQELQKIAAAIQKQTQEEKAKQGLRDAFGKATGIAKALFAGDFQGAGDILTGKTPEQIKARQALDEANAAKAAAGADFQAKLGMAGLGAPRMANSGVNGDGETKSEKMIAKNTKIMADGIAAFKNMAGGIVQFTGGA